MLIKFLSNSKMFSVPDVEELRSGNGNAVVGLEW